MYWRSACFAMFELMPINRKFHKANFNDLLLGDEMNNLKIGILVASITACFSVSEVYADAAAPVAVATPKMQHIAGAQKLKLPSMDVKDTNAFLKDLVGNTNKDMPFTCGLFRMEAGKSLTYTYDYDEAKIILEGTMTVTDGTTTAKVVPGDVLYFPKGATITFSSQSKGLGFICGNRVFGGA